MHFFLEYEKPATRAGLSACSHKASRSVEKGTVPEQGAAG
jgi:hypothetical protein